MTENETKALTITKHATKQTNEDLQKERNKRSFDPLELTYILDGGKALTEKRRDIG